MHTVTNQLNPNPNHLLIFATMLGNHILPAEDLASFHWRLLGPELPLASLKCWAHQLVLLPCDMVIKAVVNYIHNIQETSHLDAIAKDAFWHFHFRMDNKVIQFKRGIGYHSTTGKPMASPLPPKLHIQIKITWNA